MSFPGDDGYPGFKSVTDGFAGFNVMSFVAQQIVAGIATSMLVLVKTVTPGEGLLPGMVSVQPMVNQIGGDGTKMEHGQLFNIPYMRLQGGLNAIIVDPKVGDIGLAVFCMRDISSVKATKAVANPGSRRKYDFADGLYIGGFLNGTPEQYVQFTDDGIILLDKNANTIVTNTDGISITDANSNTIVMDSDGIKINGVLFDQDQNISAAADVDATGEGTFGGHTVGAHKHGGVTTGAGQTGTPIG